MDKDKGAVVGIVNYKGDILLGRKKETSEKILAGEWHIPGETMKDGEDYNQALIRGIKEEAGIDIKVGKYMASSITPTSKKQARWYECFAITSDITPGSDLEDVLWIPKRSVPFVVSKNVISYWPKEIFDYFNQ